MHKESSNHIVLILQSYTRIVLRGDQHILSMDLRPRMPGIWNRLKRGTIGVFWYCCCVGVVSVAVNGSGGGGRSGGVARDQTRKHIGISRRFTMENREKYLRYLTMSHRRSPSTAQRGRPGPKHTLPAIPRSSWTSKATKIPPIFSQSLTFIFSLAEVVAAMVVVVSNGEEPAYPQWQAVLRLYCS